jgi:hypothetical protein
MTPTNVKLPAPLKSRTLPLVSIGLVITGPVPAVVELKVWLLLSLIADNEICPLLAEIPEFRATLLPCMMWPAPIEIELKVVPFAKVLRLLGCAEDPKIKSSPATGATFPAQFSGQVQKLFRRLGFGLLMLAPVQVRLAACETLSDQISSTTKTEIKKRLVRIFLRPFLDFSDVDKLAGALCCVRNFSDGGNTYSSPLFRVTFQRYRTDKKSVRRRFVEMKGVRFDSSKDFAQA